MTQTYTLRIRDRGQLTLPKPVREQLNSQTGDFLTLVKIGNAFVLTDRQQAIPDLADKFMALMEAESVSLADLLQGLSEERAAMLKERKENAA